MNTGDRTEKILLDIVEHYIETAQPISSGDLLNRYKYDLSSATIRNIMSQLDEMDFLYQPHTSAGRVPTVKGYRYYVDKVALGSRQPAGQNKKEETKTQKELDQTEKELKEALKKSHDNAAKVLSHRLAEMTNSFAFAGLLNINHFYREGLKYLLNEPEFINAENIRILVEYAESLEERLEDLYTSIRDDINIFIGETGEEENSLPFSLMTFKSELPGREKAIFGILGPTRMPYEENIKLLEDIKDFFNDIK